MSIRTAPLVATLVIRAMGSMSPGFAHGADGSTGMAPVIEALSGVCQVHVQYTRETAELYVRSYSPAGRVTTDSDAVEFARQEQLAAATAFSGEPLGSVVGETNSPDRSYVLRV